MSKSRRTNVGPSRRPPRLPLGPRLFAILALLMIIVLALSALLPLVTTR